MRGCIKFCLYGSAQHESNTIVLFLRLREDVSDQFVSRLFRERGRKANRGLPQQHQNNRVLEITSQTRVISKA